jgi:hypothetical protein
MATSGLLITQLRSIWTTPIGYGPLNECCTPTPVPVPVLAASGDPSAPPSAATAAAKGVPPQSFNSWSKFVARMQQIMGGRRFVDWVWPVWGPAEGVFLKDLGKKQQ